MLYFVLAIPALLLSPSASVLRASPVMQLRDQSPAAPVQPREAQQVVPAQRATSQNYGAPAQNFNSAPTYSNYQSGRNSPTTGSRTRSLADISRAKRAEDPSILVQGGEPQASAALLAAPACPTLCSRALSEPSSLFLPQDPSARGLIAAPPSRRSRSS
jgi:hypothetical protein